MQRCPRRGARHRVADDGAQLVLRVGRADDRGAGRRHGRSPALGRFRAAECCCQLLDVGVGGGIPGQAEQRAQPIGRPQGLHELGLARRQARREVQHDVPDLA